MAFLNVRNVIKNSYISLRERERVFLVDFDATGYAYGADEDYAEHLGCTDDGTSAEDRYRYML
jgi:hypothetical protein